MLLKINFADEFRYLLEERLSAFYFKTNFKIDKDTLIQ